jgi:predicted transcriptional regulator of viral defense system
LLRVRRGLYLVVPPGTTSDSLPVDALLLAAKAAPDALLAYHTALEFHGRAHSSFQRFYYLSQQQQRPWKFRDFTFQRVVPPEALVRQGKTNTEVKVADRSGEPVRVTSLERTLVDVLDRPDLAGGHEELWRSLESVEYFDLDRVVEYALLLDNATTVAKVGFYLDQHREQLMVEDTHLQPLREHLPKQPHYLDRAAKGETRFAREWNLVVPRSVFERSWEEPR